MTEVFDQVLLADNIELCKLVYIIYRFRQGDSPRLFLFNMGMDEIIETFPATVRYTYFQMVYYSDYMVLICDLEDNSQIRLHAFNLVGT